MLGVSPCERTE